MPTSSSHPALFLPRRVLYGCLLTIAFALTASASAARAQAPFDSAAARALTHTIDSLTGGGNAKQLGQAYRALAELQEDAGLIDESLENYRRAIQFADRAEDLPTMSAAHNNLGLLHWMANRYDSALTHLGHARDASKAIGDVDRLARVLNSLGSSYYQLGYYEPAIGAFLDALELRRDEADQTGVSVVLTNIGKTYHDWHQFERAKPLLKQAVDAAREHKQPIAEGYALNALAMLHIDMGDFTTAQQYIDQSVAKYNSADSIMTRTDSTSAWSLNTVSQGLLYVRDGRAAQALPLLEAVYQVAAERGSVRGQARSLLYLGEAYGVLGDRRRGIDALTQSVAFSRSVAQRVLTIDALARLADLEERAGNSRAALMHLRANQALRDTIFDQSTAQRIAATEARAETEREQRENARLRAEQRVQAAVIARGRLVVALGAVSLLSAVAVLGLLAHYNRKGRDREALLARTNTELESANSELRSALSEVRTLTGLIPICAHCKKVRDDQGYWEAVETYIGSRSEASFSHSICGSCGPELYGEHWPEDVSAGSGSPS
jgi:tetratricopeptide (TPR) repeat protein